MGIYVKDEMVKQRLAGRIRFTDDPEREGEENKMSLSLLKQIIADAEGQVEQDLSSRYAAPFQTVEGASFDHLAERPTKQFLRTLVLLQCVLRALETDFGSGGPVDSSKFTDAMQKRYDRMLKDHLALKKDSYNTYINPPFPGLRLNYQNEEADTGFKGRVLSTNDREDSGTFAAGQVNAPDQTFWNGEYDLLKDIDV